MKIQLDENSYITGYALEGGFGEPNIEISDDYLNDAHFLRYIEAYQYKNGEVILDNIKLDAMKLKESNLLEYEECIMKINQFLDLKKTYEEDMAIMEYSDIDIESEREKIQPVYLRKKELEELLNA